MKKTQFWTFSLISKGDDTNPERPLVAQVRFINNIHIQTERSTDIYFGQYAPNKLRQEYPCEISSVPKEYRKVGNGWFFQKNGPYTKLINHHLKKVCFR